MDTSLHQGFSVPAVGGLAFLPSKVLSWTHGFVVVRVLLADLALIRDLLFALSYLVGFIITYFLLQDFIIVGIHCQLPFALSLSGGDFIVVWRGFVVSRRRDLLSVLCLPSHRS